MNNKVSVVKCDRYSEVQNAVENAVSLIGARAGNARQEKRFAAITAWQSCCVWLPPSLEQNSAGL